MRRAAWALACLGLLPCAAWAQAPAVRAAASKTEVTVGETFTVEVSASGPPGATWTLAGEPGNEQVVLRPALVAAGTLPPGTWRYDATVFALGDVAVPPIAVKYRLADGTEGQSATAPIPLTLVSLVAKEEKDPRLADVRPPVPLGIGRAFWIAVGVLAGALLALLVWLWRRRRPPVAAPAPVVREVPAHVEALRALDRLAASGLLEKGEHRAFYIALADVAKRYLERRFGAPVQEMTTAEMLEWMHASATLGDLAVVLRGVVGAADGVKFARAAVLAEEAARHLEAVRGLVTSVERRLRPVPLPESPRRDVA